MKWHWLRHWNPLLLRLQREFWDAQSSQWRRQCQWGSDSPLCWFCSYPKYLNNSLCEHAYHLHHFNYMPLSSSHTSLSPNRIHSCQLLRNYKTCNVSRENKSEPYLIWKWGIKHSQGEVPHKVQCFLHTPHNVTHQNKDTSSRDENTGQGWDVGWFTSNLFFQHPQPTSIWEILHQNVLQH